jgi:hypothetical protein
MGSPYSFRWANSRVDRLQGERPLHHYHAFGLRIASALELPELHPGQGPADVTISFDRIADPEPAADTVTVEGDRVHLHLWNITFQVTAGRDVAIRAPESVDIADVRIYLLGSVMASLLHQRLYLPIHANVVRIGDFAAAFAGDSGAGKSTLAAWFEREGHEVLCDDLCAIRFDEGGDPIVYEGIPRLKLWPETLALLGRDSAGLEKVASDLDKFHVPLQRAEREGSLDPVPLARIYLLDRAVPGESASIERLTGIHAAQAVLANAFRWELGQWIQDNDRTQFDQSMELARRCAVFRVRRRWAVEHVDEDAKMIERHLTAPLD